MPYATINGIRIRYEVHGSGPPLLMMAPGGFDSTIEKWSSALDVWKGVRPLETITDRYTCIAYDRREAGKSGGKVERLSWAIYGHEGKGLLDHLGIPKAYVIGGCMGCSAAIAFGAAYPEATLGLALHFPVGGVLWRAKGLRWFNEHLNYVSTQGFDAVVKLAKEKGSFGNAPAAGPWASTIATDDEFAQAYATQDMDRYIALLKVTTRTLFDRDTSPGAEPEELMALKVPAVIIPGADPDHATSAARYLQECLPRAHYHDVPPEEQTPDRVREWILELRDL